MQGTPRYDDGYVFRGRLLHFDRLKMLRQKDTVCFARAHGFGIMCSGVMNQKRFLAM